MLYYMNGVSINEKMLSQKKHMATKSTCHHGNQFIVYKTRNTPIKINVTTRKKKINQIVNRLHNLMITFMQLNLAVGLCAKAHSVFWLVISPFRIALQRQRSLSLKGLFLYLCFYNDWINKVLICHHDDTQVLSYHDDNTFI